MEVSGSGWEFLGNQVGLSIIRIFNIEATVVIYSKHIGLNWFEMGTT